MGRYTQGCHFQRFLIGHRFYESMCKAGKVKLVSAGPIGGITASGDTRSGIVQAFECTDNLVANWFTNVAR